MRPISFSVHKIHTTYKYNTGTEFSTKNISGHLFWERGKLKATKRLFSSNNEHSYNEFSNNGANVY